MGCNLNQLAQCTNKCDCGNLDTLMFKDSGKSEIESNKQKKLMKQKKYSESKNFFQITRENDNIQNIFQSNNITEKNNNNNKNKEEKKVEIYRNNNNKFNNQSQTETNLMTKEIKKNYINNCMNNVTIPGKEKNDEDSSIFEDKDSFKKMETNLNEENQENVDILHFSQIKIDDSEKSFDDIKDFNQNKFNNEEDFMDVMGEIEKENGAENEIQFGKEKCVFNGKIEDKKNVCGKGKMAMKDGRKYEGNFVNGKLEGKGRYTNFNGDIFIGNFKQGILNGKGRIIKKFENINKSNGANDEENNNKDDDNEKNMENDLIYEGDIKSFVKEGYGIEKCSEYEYKGDFHEDQKHGKGSIKYLKTGRKYSGDFLKNEITGYGTYTYENNEVYKGELLEGKKDGYGTYIWPDGGEYKGDYKNDLKEGAGELKMPNGLIFIGQFYKGKPNSKGIACYGNRSVEVEYKKGKLLGDQNKIFKILNFHPGKNRKEIKDDS